MSDISSPTADGHDDKGNFTLHVKSMAGEVLFVNCPQQDQTLVVDVKRDLEIQNPEWSVQRQCLTATLDSQIDVQADEVNEPSSKRHCSKVIANEERCDGDACTNSSYLILQDHHMLSEYGLSNGSCLDLLVKDLPWRDSDLVVQRKVMNGSVVCFKSMNYLTNTIRIDDQAAKAIALILAVRRMHFDDMY
jgi:hypothetical protein